MATVEERFKSLLQRHLKVSDSAALKSSLTELGVNSVDAVAFFKEVCSEFGIEFKADNVANFSDLQSALDYIKAST